MTHLRSHQAPWQSRRWQSPGKAAGLAFRLGSSAGALLPITGVGRVGQMALSLFQTGGHWGRRERPDPPRAALQLALQAGVLCFLSCAPSTCGIPSKGIGWWQGVSHAAPPVRGAAHSPLPMALGLGPGWLGEREAWRWPCHFLHPWHWSRGQHCLRAPTSPSSPA